jgi:glycosyltransferase involved in cell wall biosynthesis
LLPKISIVTPSLNQGQFLEETILSVINQSYPNLEYIIMDGGSTDGSRNIIKKYESQITYWDSIKDNGQANAINNGFKQCTGDIITFCNSDDTYLDGTLHHIGKKWNEWKSLGALVGAFQYMNYKSEFIEKPRKPQMKKNGPIDLTIRDPGDYRLHQVSTFFTKHALDKVGRYVDDKLHYVFDRELLYRVVKQYQIYLDKRVLGAFRLHDESKSVSKILSFSDEFAYLYRSKKNGNKRDNLQRDLNAKYHLYRGRIKYAKNCPTTLGKIKSLLIVIWIKPSLFWKRGYWAYWKKFIFKL